MQYRTLGRSGLKASVISLGSWLTFGNTVDTKETARIVRAAFERGVNLFDSADVYKNGDGELALGEAIAGLPRHKLVLATKCFFPMSDDPNDRGLSRKHVHESIGHSLRRLGTDYLDLYQCHRFDPDTPLLETARAMDDLIGAGKTLYWGTSQWPAERLAEVVALCQTHGLHAPISNQPLYNLFDRGIEAEVLPTSERCGLGQLVFSPLAQGVLTGKYLPEQKPPKGSRGADARLGQFVERYLQPQRLLQAQQLVQLAKAQGCTAGQLALRFCLRDPRLTAVIVGARSEAQLLESIAAAELQPGPEVLAELERLFPV